LSPSIRRCVKRAQTSYYFNRREGISDWRSVVRPRRGAQCFSSRQVQCSRTSGIGKPLRLSGCKAQPRSIAIGATVVPARVGRKFKPLCPEVQYRIRYASPRFALTVSRDKSKIIVSLSFF
jgi:hypothetical protein